MSTKIDYGFKKDFVLSNHVIGRLAERTSFTNIDILKALYQKRYAKLGLRRKVAIPQAELNALLESTYLTFRELTANSIISFDTLSYLLVWSGLDEAYFIVVLKEVDDAWLVLTILPSTYLEQYDELAKSAAYRKAKERMLKGRPQPEESPYNFKRYVLVVLWIAENGQTCVKTTNLKEPIETYSANEDFLNIALSVTNGIRPERIIVRSRIDVDDILVDINLD